MPRTYTDDDRIKALAALEFHAGNVSRASAETGIPRATITLWRDTASDAVASEEMTRPAVTDTAPAVTAVTKQRHQTDWVGIFETALRQAVTSLESKIPDMNGKDTAITVGILTDKLLDMRDGRKSATTVDQSQNLVLPPGTTLDDLRGLRDQMRGQLRAAQS